MAFVQIKGTIYNTDAIWSVSKSNSRWSFAEGNDVPEITLTLHFTNRTAVAYAPDGFIPPESIYHVEFEYRTAEERDFVFNKLKSALMVTVLDEAPEGLA